MVYDVVSYAGNCSDDYILVQYSTRRTTAILISNDIQAGVSKTSDRILVTTTPPTAKQIALIGGLFGEYDGLPGSCICNDLACDLVGVSKKHMSREIQEILDILISNVTNVFAEKNFMLEVNVSTRGLLRAMLAMDEDTSYGRFRLTQ